MCLKNHSCNLHAPLYGIFCLHSVDVARYAALIQAKSPINCDIYLAESIFQTHSRAERLKENLCKLDGDIIKADFIMPINDEKIKKSRKIVKLVVQIPFELPNSEAIRQ